MSSKKGFSFWKPRKTTKKTSPPATPPVPSSGYNSDEEGSITEARPSPPFTVELGAQQSGGKYFYDLKDLQKCYPAYLTVMQDTITLKGNFQWANIMLTDMFVFTPPSTRVKCNISDGTVTYHVDKAGPYGSEHQIWSSLSIMLYDFGHNQYGVFALNLAPNYALKLEEDATAKDKVTVTFAQACSIEKVQKFKMTGPYNKLKLSGQVKAATYYLFAADVKPGCLGTLSAVCASQRDKVQESSIGTYEFAFQRPIYMGSLCPNRH